MTQDVRDYAASQGLTEDEVLQKGMKRRRFSSRRAGRGSTRRFESHRKLCTRGVACGCHEGRA